MLGYPRVRRQGTLHPDPTVSDSVGAVGLREPHVHVDGGSIVGVFVGVEPGGSMLVSTSITRSPTRELWRGSGCVGRRPARGVCQPAGLSFEEAAGFPVTAETAIRILNQVGVQPGETLLVSGAAAVLARLSSRLLGSGASR